MTLHKRNCGSCRRFDAFNCGVKGRCANPSSSRCGHVVRIGEPGCRVFEEDS